MRCWGRSRKKHQRQKRVCPLLRIGRGLRHSVGVARQARVIIPGVAHHVTQRGNNHQVVFRSADERWLYLGLLRKHAVQHGSGILAYCLMTNHVHLVAIPETPDSLARTLGRTHSEYAYLTNRDAGRCGHLWQGRFFSCPLDIRHLFNAIRYVELNPVRAGLVSTVQEWRWSSARAHTVPGIHDPLLVEDWKAAVGGWNFAEWAEMLGAEMDPSECDAVRHVLRPRSPGRPRKRANGVEEGIPGSLLDSCTI